MTIEDWQKLAKKSGPVTKKPEDTPIDLSPQPVAVSTDDLENPFASDNDVEGAVDAALELVTTDEKKIKTITQIASPKVHATLHMVAEWERQEGAEELAALDDYFGVLLEQFECGRKGKDNRAKLVAEILKAQRQQEMDVEAHSLGGRLMGK